MRSLMLAAALLVPTPTAPPLPGPVDLSAVVQVVCPWIDKQHGLHVRMGTAFRVGQYLISVNHVMSPGECYINEKQATVLYTSHDLDFSMIYSESGPFIPVDCGGFIKGHKYIAVGFARGAAPVTTVELVATGEHLGNGQAVLRGIFTVIPGMSGGPVIDEETGKVVGTVNTADFIDGLSGSIEFKDTPVCSA